MSDPSPIFTARFWKGCGERAIKTYAEAALGLALAVMGVQTVPAGADLLAAASRLTGSAIATVLLAALVPTVLSLFASLASADFVAGDKGAPAEDVAAALATGLRTAGATITPSPDPEPGTVPAREA